MKTVQLKLAKPCIAKGVPFTNEFIAEIASNSAARIKTHDDIVLSYGDADQVIGKAINFFVEGGHLIGEFVINDSIRQNIWEWASFDLNMEDKTIVSVIGIEKLSSNYVS